MAEFADVERALQRSPVDGQMMGFNSSSSNPAIGMKRSAERDSGAVARASIAGKNSMSSNFNLAPAAVDAEQLIHLSTAVSRASPRESANHPETSNMNGRKHKMARINLGGEENGIQLSSFEDPMSRSRRALENALMGSLPVESSPTGESIAGEVAGDINSDKDQAHEQQVGGSVRGSVSRTSPGAKSGLLERRLTSSDGDDNGEDEENGRFGKLSEEERKRRRAESNRLSAERSRERRKNYMKGLELGVKNLQAENVELKKAVLLYQQQIKMLTEIVRSTGSQEQVRAVAAVDAKVREHFK
uniref:BZIP domain-containing protein n=1 Tax=Erythrolobus madagascarensis TaxID=708628 RepID=A0A7S0T4P9_9RHOD|mmetsp:Transcript_1169/g.2348  ORF Transcript_1169/g.2348 Transcript_1169/m.2348 type:complete len:302 (+) Transcript_1169:235-1140(+)